MNDQSVAPSSERHVQAGKFFVRLYRYRTLLLKRWWVLFISIAIGLAVEAVYLRYAPPVFTSVGQMIVGIKLNIEQEGLYQEDLNTFSGTQVQLMRGDEVRRRAADRVASLSPNLTPPKKPVYVDVSLPPKSSIFILRATGESPEYTKAFLQACMDEYINLKKQMVAKTSELTTSGLYDQMMLLKPQIDKADDDIQSFLSTNDVALIAEASGMSGYMVSLYQQLATLESEADLLRSMTLDQSLLLEQSQIPLMANLSGMSGASLPGSGVSAGGASTGADTGGQSAMYAPATIGTEYLTVKQQILLLQADRDRYAEYLKPKHPEMAELDQQIERLGRVLKIYRQQSIEQLDARTNALALQIKNLEMQTKQRGQENLELTRKASQYQRLQAKSQRLQALNDQLLATLQTLDVNKEISPESVTIYEPASDPYQEKVVPWKSLLRAGLIGLVAGLALLLLLDRLDDRMSSFTELQEMFEEEVLGQIPRERRPDRSGIIPHLQPNDQRHSFVEAYRNLRSTLLYMVQSEARPRTLLITSSVPGDGKSLTATNLAITMALGGSKVLLVDADLRKGTLHNRFNLQAKTGFAEVFLQGTDWHQVVQPTDVPNLSILPRGTTTQRSSEFFIGPVMEKFLKDSREEYDYVLIDTAPVMAADDVTSLAPRVDGVVFVIRSEFTSSRVAHSALNMLYQRKARILGLVFNSVHVNAGDYYYYYRYQDYHKQP
jgi:capsular exopolysaccharide synthesis family protein